MGYGYFFPPMHTFFYVQVELLELDGLRIFQEDQLDQLDDFEDIIEAQFRFS